jgi:aerobic carbon-monoxide dehydrogenase medium subunit
VSRRHGDFALAGAAAVVTLDPRGHVVAASIGLLGVHDRAVRATEAERVITGERPDAAAIRAAADAAGQLDADPATDVHASSAYRRHLAGVMVRRVLTRAIARATARG